MKSLQETQKLIWKFITAPEGVEKALKDFPNTRLPLEEGEGKRISAAERLDIYANMYFFRILDSLKEDFPAVLKVLGEIGFHNLITEYLLKYPSSHWSLRYAGQRLPLFLKNHPSRKRYPFLSELAFFEWMFLEAFDAADANSLSRENLSKTPADQWGLLKLKCVPSVQMGVFQFPIVEIQRDLLKNKKITPKKQKSFALVWRQNDQVLIRTLETSEYLLLSHLRKSSTFGSLCILAQKKLRGDAAQIMNRYLQRWIEEGLLKN